MLFNPVFWVSGLDAVPSEQDSGKARISKVMVEVVAATITDHASGNTYTVKVEEQPSFVPIEHYVYALRLVGPLPLERGQIKGKVEVRMSAWAEYNGVVSRPRIVSKTIFLSN